MLRILLGALLAALFAAPAAAQEPKPGNAWYEDEVQLGFKVKAPKDWAFTPGSPLDQNVIGKYAPTNGEGVGLGGDAGVFVNVWLLRFDRRGKGAEVDDGKERDESFGGGARDVRAWMTRGIDKGVGWRVATGPEPLKGPPVPSEAYVFEGMSTESIRSFAGNHVGNIEAKPIRVYAAVFRLAPDLEIALVGVGPGEKKWRSYEKAFEALAKTFQPVALAAARTGAPTGRDPRSVKRAALEAEMARTPGWRMLETENYFIVSSSTDEDFLGEVEERIEALRKVFLVDYPPEKARLVSREKKPVATEKEREPGAQQDAERTVALVNPLEASRSSVVRVCANQEQYVQYGGSPNAPGYWNAAAEELVLFDDRAGGGRGDTWIVLNHEAFHQYIFYFYGSISPHSWYNEGTGDFYGGYEYEHKKFTLKEMPWRIRGIQEALRQGPSQPGSGTGYAPLHEIVRWTQQQYYNPKPPGKLNPYDLSGPDCYAQGWSLIYFLRTGEKKRAKGWDPRWGTILDTYLATLATTGDLDEAVDLAFEGVDWDALEASWKNYILSL